MERWTDALRRITENPSQNATAIATGVAIVVLLVVVIILVAIAFVMPNRHPDSEGLGDLVRPKRTRPRWVSWLVGWAIVIAGFSGAIAIWYAGTSSNSYCTSTCHAMAAPTESWAISAHSKVACVRCHEGRMWSSLPRGVARRTLCLYYEVTGEAARGDRVPPANCMQCHRNVVEKPLVARNGETFLHGEALTFDTGCTRCHGDQGHELAHP